MPIQSVKKVLVGTAAMLFLATSLYLPMNVQAQRRAKRKLPVVQKITVALTENGYEPTSLRLRRGVPAKVTFIRKVSATCGTQIVIAEYGIKRALPLNEPVLVEFTPKIRHIQLYVRNGDVSRCVGGALSFYGLSARGIHLLLRKSIDDDAMSTVKSDAISLMNSTRIEDSTDFSPLRGK